MVCRQSYIILITVENTCSLGNAVRSCRTGAMCWQGFNDKRTDCKKNRGHISFDFQKMT